MFGFGFKSLSLNTLGKSIADYLDTAGEAVLTFNPVEGIPSVSDISEDNSSYKQVKAQTRLMFDCGVIWSMAYVTLRDEEYKNLSEAKAIAKTDKNLNKFLKEGMKYVSKHDYKLPKVYTFKAIINYEIDARSGTHDSPFNKGVEFAGTFLREFYQISTKS